MGSCITHKAMAWIWLIAGLFAALMGDWTFTVGFIVLSTIDARTAEILNEIRRMGNRNDWTE